jgi:hemerythrin-like domain-containing protein
MGTQTIRVTIKLFLSLLLGIPLLSSNLPAFGSSVTEPLLEEHVKIKARVNHVDAMVRQLDATKAEDQKKIMLNIVKLLKDTISEHAAEEEQVTYPAVDKLAKSSKLKSTASMRYEHGIIRKWIEELELQAKQSQVEEFMRKAIAYLA